VNADTVRILIAAGFFMVLIFLRLEADRFGAAEYDEPGRKRTGPWTRLSWYVIGFVLLAAIYFVHPESGRVLYMVPGRKLDVLLFGGILALIGLGQAAAFARFRYGYLRLPPGEAYPGAAVNSVATAIIDEAAFRGVVLGTLVALGAPAAAAIVLSTIAYVLATRLAAPGRHPYALLLAAGMGLAFGWVTLATGGIGAAIVGHAVTTFGVFVFTGHAGQVQFIGREPEELESKSRLPEGWQDARRGSSAGRGAEPSGFVGATEPSGFSDRAGHRTADGKRVRGKTVWVRFSGRPENRQSGRRAR